MGILDSLKNVLGGKEKDSITASTRSPSQILKKNGIDPSGLKFSFGSDGTVTINGNLQSESDRQRVLDALDGTPGIEKIVDHMSVAESGKDPASSAPEPAPVEAGEKGGPTAGENTYTVISGDTLWKISKEIYGEGSKYMKIFEANRDILENPDRIYAGQTLKIPPE